MGFWSSVGNVVSNTINAIGTGISKTVGVIAPLLSKAPTIVNQVVAIAQVVMAVVNILRPDEKVETIGDRAIQAAEEGVTPDKFDRYDEYMAAIRGFELDPRKTENYTDQEKVLAGLSVCSHALDEKLQMPAGTSGQLWLLTASNPAYFDAPRLENLISSERPADTINYFTGQLGPAAELKVEDRLLNLEKGLSPEKSDDAIFKELDAVKHDLRRA